MIDLKVAGLIAMTPVVFVTGAYTGNFVNDYIFGQNLISNSLILDSFSGLTATYFYGYSGKRFFTLRENYDYKEVISEGLFIPQIKSKTKKKLDSILNEKARILRNNK